MKITPVRYLLVFFILIFFLPGCASLGEKKKKFPNAKIIYADCSKYMKKLNDNNVRSMVTYKDWMNKKPDSISGNKRFWVYKDNRSDKTSHELYKLRVGRPFSMSLLNVRCVLYKFHDIGKPYYKIYFAYETPGHLNWSEHGTIPVYVDIRNKIMVIKYVHFDIQLFGYFEEGYLLKK